MKRLIILFIVLLVSCGTVFSQKKDTYRVRTVVIDPGHGGAKPGARGSRSLEKNITLSVAKKFGKLIHDNYPDVKVIYTRTTDVDISLAERARIANRNKADLFISIHANSHQSSVPNGVETFVMGLSESKANLEVAKKENADILLEADYKDNADYSVFDPNSPESYVLLAMFQNAYLEKSLNFAQAIQSQYMRNIKTINRGVKQAELFVLYKTTCPSVLTEIGFISNPNEEAYMLSDEGQAKIAISLFNAFMTFKATEEGSNKPANPKVDIPGYKSANQGKAVEPKPEPKPEPKVEPKPEVAVVAEPVKEEPKPVQPTPEAKAEVVEAKPAQPAEEPKPAEPVKQEEPAAPQAKPTPTVALPPQPVQQEAPKTEQAPEPIAVEAQQPEPAAEGASETLQPPKHTVEEGVVPYFTVQFLSSPVIHKVGAPILNGISDFQITKSGKYNAYTTGRFRTREEAVEYCAHIKRVTRFKDAWVYQFKGAKPAEAAADKTANKPADKPVKAKAAVEGLTFRVQFCTASKVLKPGDPELQGIKDIHYSQNDNSYVYSAGDYSTVQEARQRCNKIKSSTKFRDAFVIAIYNGERITLEQAAALKKK